MTFVLLTIHSLIVISLIAVVLLQRSEGGALGMGSGGIGGFMTGRGAANVLTRTTSVLAFLFFTTSILLGVFHGRGETDDAVLKELTTGADKSASKAAPATEAPKSTDDLLKSLGSGSGAAAPATPAETVPAPTDDSLLGQQPESTPAVAPAPSSPPPQEAPAPQDKPNR